MTEQNHSQKALEPLQSLKAEDRKQLYSSLSASTVKLRQLATLRLAPVPFKMTTIQIPQQLNLEILIERRA